MAAKTEQKPSEDKVNAARDKNLDLAIQQIAKDYGDGLIMRLGDDKIVDIDVIPTGNILIDRALGVGGFPRGRVVEVYGPESSGKTTLTLTVIAQAQKRGGLAAFIDVEHALDPQYARKLGVNLDDLLVSQPNSGEEALRICETLVTLKCTRRDRNRFGGGPRNQSRARGRDRRHDRRRTSALDERGAAQAYLAHFKSADLLHFHESNSRKDRSHVRKPGDNARWESAEVLRQRARRYSTDRRNQAD